MGSKPMTSVIPVYSATQKGLRKGSQIEIFGCSIKQNTNLSLVYFTLHFDLTIV